MSNAGPEDWRAKFEECNRDRTQLFDECRNRGGEIETLTIESDNFRLLVRAICRSKALFAMNGFVIEGAGWMAVSFDAEGLPILTDNIIAALKAI